MKNTRSKYKLRPTSSIVKNALFNIVGDIRGKKFLDLFCGTGQIGKKAEELGADVTFVDISWVNIKNLKGKVKGKLVKGDALSFLKRDKSTYHIIFADPPYDYSGYAELIDLALSRLEKGGLFILEHDKRKYFDADKRKVYGDTALSVWIKDE